MRRAARRRDSLEHDTPDRTGHARIQADPASVRPDPDRVRRDDEADATGRARRHQRDDLRRSGVHHPGGAGRLDPMNLVAFTDAAGFFEIANIPVPGRCRWATVTISKDGFGTSRRVDEPIAPGFSRGQIVLRAEPTDEYIGPPLAEAYLGESYCTR
jgi:hypothetical protein